MAILGWLLIGLIAGWAAGEVMRGRGFGVLGNIVVGILGALVGGFLFGLLGFGPENWVGSLVTAFLGAVLLLMLVGAVSRSPAV